LAHYAIMHRLRTMPGCNANESVEDKSVRDRFAGKINKLLAQSLRD
jgi:hypothetical protein